MKSSNLAEQLEEFEVTLESLRLAPPATRRVVEKSPPVLRHDQKPARRGSRVRGIEIRGQGLRSFRVF